MRQRAEHEVSHIALRIDTRRTPDTGTKYKEQAHVSRTRVPMSYPAMAFTETEDLIWTEMLPRLDLHPLGYHGEIIYFRRKTSSLYW